jgi:iron complex transport system ATP-binding protein
VNTQSTRNTQNAPALEVRGATLAYETRVVGQDIDLEVREGSFTVIIGPNACGKSTTLRALSNLLRPRVGSVLLDGQDIHTLRSKELARRLGLLPQTALAPEGITVHDLVARGRYPHQSLFSRWTEQDRVAVADALEQTGITDLEGRYVDELSGGQRQRVWVAMALAQQTGLLLLDEPTTFLDVAHQISLLDLFAMLHDQGRTLVAVLHDINHAARYATDLVVMKEGRIVTRGAPQEVITATLLREVFGLEAIVIEDPVNGGPLVVPRHRAGTAVSSPAA